jgi:hypothetical protein
MMPIKKGFAETIPTAVMKRLRDAVAPPGKRGTWLRYLDDNRLAEVFIQLQSGTAAQHIATVAQREWGIKPQAQTKSLARAVRAFRDKVVGEIQKLPTKTDRDKEVAKKLKFQAKKVSEEIEELEEAGWVLLEQKKRIQLFRDKENIAKMGFQATDKAIQVYLQTLELYAKMKINMGLIEPPAAEHHLHIKHKFAGLMQHTVGKDGDKVIGALDKFMELVDEKSLALTQNDQGAFEYVPAKEGKNAITSE